MSIVHKYQFGGSDGLAAALRLEDMATIMTSTFQLGGGSAIKNLAVPAGLVLNEYGNKTGTEETSTVLPLPLPEEMFDRMLSLVSPGDKMVVSLNHNKTKRNKPPTNKKTRRS